MVYNTSNTRFASATELYHVTPDATRIKWYEWLNEKITEADKANTFGGKRLLGVTDKGNPMWVTMTIERDTLEMTITLTHELDTIRKSKLCPRKVTVGNNEKIPNIEHAMRPATKIDHGEVTQRTLDYIEQLITLNESQIHYTNGKCNSLMFLKAAHCIYNGSPDKGKFRAQDIMKTWNLPKGSYFIID